MPPKFILSKAPPPWQTLSCASKRLQETHTGPLKLPGTKPRQETLTTLYESPGVTWGHMSDCGLIVGHSSLTGWIALSSICHDETPTHHSLHTRCPPSVEFNGGVEPVSL